MGTFFKAVFIGLLMMALLMCSAHHWIGFDIVIDGTLIEPIIGLGAIMLAFLITMVVVGLVIAGIFGSILVAAFLTVIIGGVALLSGLLFSWPVLLGIVVIWLLVRDKPRRCAYERY